MNEPEEMCMVVEVEENEFGEIVIIHKDANTELEEVIEDDYQIVLDSPDEDVVAEESVDKMEIVYLPDFIEDDIDSSEYTVLEGEVVDGSIFYTPQPIISKTQSDLSSRLLKSGKTKTKPFVTKILNQKTSLNLKKVEKNFCVSKATVNKRSPNSARCKLNKREPVWQHTNFVAPEESAISSVTTINTRTDDVDSVTRSIVNHKQNNVVVFNPTRPHRCDYCQQSFREAASLHIHLTRTHKVIPENCIVS